MAKTNIPAEFIGRVLTDVAACKIVSIETDLDWAILNLESAQSFAAELHPEINQDGQNALLAVQALLDKVHKTMKDSSEALYALRAPKADPQTQVAAG